MRKLSIRWILPVVAMLLLMTALALAPLVSNAAGKTTTPTTPTPVVTPTPGGMHTDVLWHM
jgi:hypothetical protein